MTITNRQWRLASRPEGVIRRSDFSTWVGEGRLSYRVDVVEGLEHAPVVINKLFDGSNQGKLIVRVSPEPGQ